MRMIQEFAEALSRIQALKKGQRWNEASGELDAEFKKLVGTGAEAVARLSETELLARLMQEGPTQAVRDKTLILTAMLAQAAEVAEGAGRDADGRECRLKALHLLLDVLANEGEFEFPDFVPKVEVLRELLGDGPLPQRTLAMLMRHYERTGELAKAEDALYALLDSDPGNDNIVGFGRDFYRRLQGKTDGQLEEGGLPRAEVEEGLKELQGRQPKK